MSLAAFIADQRTSHRVPHTVTCRALGVSPSWLYKWQHRSRVPSPVQQRRAELDTAVAEVFEAAHGLQGSPWILIDLRASGWVVSEKTVAKSMARQGLVARPKKRRKNLTRPDKRAVPFPDLVKRDFTAPAPNKTWVGDMTEIPTGEGKLYLSTAIDLFSRRLLGYATSCHPDAELAGETIKMAVTARGGNDHVTGLALPSQWVGPDRALTMPPPSHSSPLWSTRCSLGIIFKTRQEAQETIVKWVVDFYNCRRRHSSCGMQSPIDYETSAAERAA